MQVNPFSAAAIPNTNSSTPTITDPGQDTKDMFLQLLTAQLKNQSPLSPVDPMQFTTQLVQFNMLDQLSQIRSLLQQAGGASGSIALPTGGN